MGSEKSVGVLEVENSISSGGLGGKGCSPLSPASLLRGATQSLEKGMGGVLENPAHCLLLTQ